MKGDGLECRARDVGAGAAAGEAEDGTTRIGLPVRRTQPDKCGHHDDAAAVGHAVGQGLHLLAGLNHSQAITQPLHHRTAHEHTAFQCELRCHVADARRLGADEPVFGGHHLFATVHQHEAAGAIGVFGHAGFDAGLAEEGALLVANQRTNRDRRA